jgi:hypothetical protein
MWLLILMAVNINDPRIIPGTATIEFPTQIECERARQTVKSELSSRYFKLETQCIKKDDK